MRNVFLYLVLTFLFLGCTSNVVLSESTSLPNEWDKDHPISFTFQQPDATHYHNIFILIRNTNDYPFNNLFLIVSMEFPHGKIITDTLEYRMANPDGSWLGTGLGDTKENKLWYKEHIQFPEKGNYTLSIQQAVRNNGEVNGVSKLEGITSVGFSIEKITQ